MQSEITIETKRAMDNGDTGELGKSLKLNLQWMSNLQLVASYFLLN